MPLIKGIQKTTLVDYPGKIAATIFLAGCNMRCSFCHNASLVQEDKIKELPSIPENEIIEYLRGRIQQLDGVCVSGGEPTVYSDLPDFLRKIKLLGYAVKLDTNGTAPEMLSYLIQEKLVDYLAMDLKGPIELYPRITNAEVNTENIKKSIDLIIKSGVAHEFRTTVLPEFHNTENIKDMACLIKGGQAFYLQQFRKEQGVLNEQFQTKPTYTPVEMKAMIKVIEPFVRKAAVRGIA